MRKIIIVFVLLVCFSAVCFSQNPPRSAAEPVVVTKFPQPRTNGPISLEQAMEKRRSIRQFTAEPLTVDQIGQLCWSAQGITDPNKGLRTAPSPGALYPMQLYVLQPDGLHLYQPAGHELTRLISHDIRTGVSNAAFNQRVIQNAPCTFIIAGSMVKIEAKYRSRGEKFTNLEAGHIAQNIQLQAVTLGLGSVPIGTFDPKTISQICKMPQDLEVLYLVTVGNPTEKPVLAPAVNPVGGSQSAGQTGDIRTKRVVIIMPGKYFYDSEYFGVEQALSSQGIKTVVASSVTSEIKGIEVRGVQRNVITPTLLVKDLKVEDYDAFVFIGGTREYFDNRDAINLVRAANSANKVLAAISNAPGVFANADIIRGRNVTSATSERYKLINAGGQWKKVLLVTDGNLITAGGPEDVSQMTTGGPSIADRFGMQIVSLLRQRTD